MCNHRYRSFSKKSKKAWYSPRYPVECRLVRLNAGLSTSSSHPQRLEPTQQVPAIYNTSEFPCKISCVSEPAPLKISLVTIDLTSTDIVSHLCQRGFKRQYQANHSVFLQSLYTHSATLFTRNTCGYCRSSSSTLRFDSSLTWWIRLPIRKVLSTISMDHGTIFPNPERWAKSYSAGCFARIFVSGEDKSEDEMKGRPTANNFILLILLAWSCFLFLLSWWTK